MKIAHIADVHIRLKDRQQEYKEVFEKLYDDLAEVDVDRIVLAGDIVHSKITMSPELVVLTTDFFKNLLEIAPVDLIAGNHDMNMSNQDRLDALTPIVNSVKDYGFGLTYYEKTGYHEVPGNPSPGIIYGVNSLLDDKPYLRLTKDQKKTGNIYIALYHGSVQGCVLDNNFSLDNADVSMHTFENFDYVMLGDIHKRQSIRPDGTMWYPGSLIQQNHGEELEKGYLVWHIEPDNFDVEFRRLENQYGFFTIHADGGILPDLSLPEKCRVRVIWPSAADQISKSEIIKLNSMIKEKYGVTSIQLLFRPSISNSKKEIEFNGLINVNDFNVQKVLLRKWSEIENIDEKTILKLEELDFNIHEKVVKNEFEDFTNCNWSLKSIEIENFMSYGSPVKLDFEKTKGIVGLFGENAVGKSVIIDAILYALFNKITRNVKNEELINKNIDDEYCKVILELDIKGIIYRLERKSEKKYQKSGAYIHTRTDVDLKRQNENGKWENLNETQRTETEKIIRNAIGSYEDFITTTLSTQNGDSEFIQQRPAARATNMLRLLGLDVFIKKYDYAKDVLRNYDYEIKNYNRDSEIELRDVHISNLKKLEKVLSIYKQNGLEAKKETEKIIKEINELSEKIHTGISIKEPIPKLKEDVKILEKNIEELSENKKGIENKIEKIQNKIRAIEDEFILDNSDLIECSEKAREAEKIRNKIVNLSHKISSQKRVLEIYKKDITNSNACPVVDDPRHITCAYLKNFISKKEECNGIISETKNLIKEKNELEEELKRYESSEDVLKTQEFIREKLNQGIEKIKSLDQELFKFKNEIGVKEVSLKLAKSIYENAKSHEEIVEENLRLTKKINELKVLRKEKDKKYLEYGQLISDTQSDIAVLKRDINDLESRLEKIEQIEEDRIVYKTYCSAMHRDGIPIGVLNQYIPKINFEINKILSNVVPFGIYLKIDESTNINIVMRSEGMTDDTRPAAMGSGMESLLTNFAIRYALISVSNLNKSSVWIIDEGFGVLDQNNLYSVSKFFENTHDVFKNIIIITHIDELKDIANWVFNVEKKNGISYVLSPQQNI